MGLDENKCRKVYTSGESALKHLEKNYKEKKFYHIGPPRDFDLFKLFEKNNETYFKYNPRKINYRQKNKFNNDNTFNVLNQINFD